MFLSESRGAGRVHIVTRVADSATVQLVTAEQGQALRALGATAADAIGVDRFLVVEGPSDRDVIEALFAETLLAGRIGLIEAGGGSRVRPVADVVEGLVAAFEGKVLGVADSDEEHRAAVSGVHFLPCREIENLFLSMPHAIRDVLQRRGHEVDTDQIQTAIDTAVGELRLEALWLSAASSLRGNVDLVSLRFHRGSATFETSSSGLKRLRDQGTESIPDDATVDQAWQEASTRFDTEWASRKLDLVHGSKALQAIFKDLSDDAATYKKTRDLRSLAEAALAHRCSWPPALIDLESAIKALATGDVGQGTS